MFYEYNGIKFDILKTNIHSMEAVYSEDGADYLYTQCHVDVSAVLNPHAMSYAFGPSAVVGQNPAATIASIRNRLLQPRGTLRVEDFGGVVVESPASGYIVDVANGPFPRRCDIQQVNGARTWIMRWSCDFAITDCLASDGGILSNRYTTTHTINEYHLTTRTAYGRTKFRSDVMNATGKYAHELFNGNLLPDQPKGFQRESLDVTLDSDGLGIYWRIRDVEKMYDIGETDARQGGSGIVRIEGSCGLSTWNAKEGMAGGNSLAQIDIRAYGNRYSNQWTMMQRCFQIIIAKLQLDESSPVGFVTNASLRESLGTNEKWVEVSVTMMQFVVKGQPVQSPASIRLDPMMLDVFYVFEDSSGINPGIPNAEGTRGTSEITAFTAALQAACEVAEKPPVLVGSGSQGQGASSGPQPAITVSPTQVSQNRDNKYKAATQKDPYPYTHYKMSKEFHVIANTLMLPTTAPPPGSSSSTGSGSQGTGSGQDSPSWKWPASIISLGSPTGVLKVEFMAECVGAPPLLPSITSTDPNLVLSNYRLVAEAPEVWVDGATTLYTVHGYYEYNMRSVPQKSDPLAMGVLPWTTISFTDSLIQPDSFSTGVFDDPSGTSSSSMTPQ